MKKLINTTLLAFIIMFLFSCTKSGSTSTSNLRFINLSPDAGAMDVYVNNALAAGGVGYGVGSSYQMVGAAGASMSINQSGTANILLSGNISLNANSYYSAIVYDSVAILKGNVFQDDRAAPPSGKTYVRFFNYVSGTPSVDIIRAGSTSTKLFASRTYLDHTSTISNIAYSAFDPGPFSVSAVVAGTNVLITQLPGFEAAAGKSYTLVLRGFNTGTGTQAIYLAPITDQ